MRYAESGYNLEIDLTTSNIEKVETDPRLMEQYLGGQGSAAKILWDRVPLDTHPFSEENLLIFSSGLLNATPIPGANRTAVNTFSPQTNLQAHSLMGSFFGVYMKFAGYDKIILKGKASGLVYLWIYNDKVEIRDAGHLAGLGAQRTAEQIKKELGNDDTIQVAAIGLAGENRVYYASIEHSHSSASRAGVGAVMGDKRVKAIAIKGTKDIPVANPNEAFKLFLNLRKDIGGNPNVGDWMAVDEDDSFHHNHFAWGNARTRRRGYWTPEIEEKFTRIKYDHMDRQTSCYNCPKVCHNVISWPGKPRFSYKCYGKDTYHMAAFKELDFSYRILPVTQEHGLDSYSAPQAIALAVELYDDGILTDEDMPDFPEDNEDRFFYLVDKIVNREGIGDALANGVYWAARQIGRGAEAYDHNTIKKFEQLPLKLYKLNPVYFLMYATGNKISITQIEGSFPQNPLPTKEEREQFVAEWESAPNERMKQYFLNWEKRDQLSIQACCEIVEWNEMMHTLDDSLGLCGFLSSFRGQFGGKAAYHINNLPGIISTVTGLDIDKDKLWEIGLRNRNLVRALNIRRGMRRADEQPPEDHWQVRDADYERELLDSYYEYRGWNKEGIPDKEMLSKLGLDYVYEDFLQRGIIDE